MKYLLIVSLVGLFKLISSHETQIPSGIFATHSAMANDKPLPGYKISFKHTPDSSSKWVTYNNLIIEPKIKNAKQFMWGFSDGKDYYINSFLYDHEGPIRYSKIYYKGKRFSTFTAVINLALPHQQMFAGIDMQTGKIFPISKGIVRELIEDDKVLLDKFNQTAKNKNDYAGFLIQYDQKH